MFIASGVPHCAHSVGAACNGNWKAHSAPLERPLFLKIEGYKHGAPPEHL